MTLVGAVARVTSGRETTVRRRLGQLDGVESLSTERPGTVGLVIEAGDADEAHRILTQDVGGDADVLAVWPVSACYDEPGDDSAGQSGAKGDDHALRAGFTA